jgi:hypothetical protein
MTDYLFGYCVAGKSWHEINQVYHPASGTLFLVVLFVTAIAPRVAARLREPARPTGWDSGTRPGLYPAQSTD